MWFKFDPHRWECRQHPLEMIIELVSIHRAICEEKFLFLSLSQPFHQPLRYLYRFDFPCFPTSKP